MNSILTLKGLCASILILCTVHLSAQISIKYIDNDTDATQRQLIFIDTSHQNILNSFFPIEKSPYWNLQYPEIVNSNSSDYYTVKYFDLKGIPSICRNEIPGLVSIAGDTVITNPYGATTSQTCIFSENHRFVFIYSAIYFSGVDVGFNGFAMNIQIYNSSGNVLRDIYSTDGEIVDPGLTNDGKYFFYSSLVHQAEFPGRHRFINRIIDLHTMRTITEVKDEDLGVESLYSKIFDDFICLMTQRDSGITQNVQNDCFLICFDLTNKIKYSGIIDPKYKYNLKGIASNGIIFESDEHQDSNTFIMKFSEFQTEIIE